LYDLLDCLSTLPPCPPQASVFPYTTLFRSHDLKVVAVRHPMPYGDLAEQKVQRFATVEDLKKHKCTIEEMEEYEPHVERGNIIYGTFMFFQIFQDRKSTRLNSSHVSISYAVFCLKKKKKT